MKFGYLLLVLLFLFTGMSSSEGGVGYAMEIEGDKIMFNNMPNKPTLYSKCFTDIMGPEINVCFSSGDDGGPDALYTQFKDRLAALKVDFGVDDPVEIAREIIIDEYRKAKQRAPSFKEALQTMSDERAVENRALELWKTDTDRVQQLRPAWATPPAETAIATAARQRRVNTQNWRHQRDITYPPAPGGGGFMSRPRPRPRAGAGSTSPGPGARPRPGGGPTTSPGPGHEVPVHP